METRLGWHFTGANAAGQPILRDGRPCPPIGKWLTHDGPVKMCMSGLHFSPRIIDALTYAPGCILHRVEVADIVDTNTDKAVCRRRRIVASANMIWALVELAEGCALNAARYAARYFALYAASYASTAASYAPYAASYASDAAFYASDAAFYASYAARYSSYAAFDASYAASTASYAASTASYAASYSSYAASAAEIDWQESTLQLWFECLSGGH